MYIHTRFRDGNTLNQPTNFGSRIGTLGLSALSIMHLEDSASQRRQYQGPRLDFSGNHDVFQETLYNLQKYMKIMRYHGILWDRIHQSFFGFTMGSTNRRLLRLHLRETGGCIFVSARGHVVPATLRTMPCERCGLAEEEGERR